MHSKDMQSTTTPTAEEKDPVMEATKWLNTYTLFGLSKRDLQSTTVDRTGVPKSKISVNPLIKLSQHSEVSQLLRIAL